MDGKDLRKIFLVTACLTVVVFLVALPISLQWAVRYGCVGILALLNWIALSLVLSGLTGKNNLRMIVGLMIKPLLLVLLLILAVNGGIEITSFLSGVNTFFLTLFGYIAWNRPKISLSKINLIGDTKAHG